ncbi:manganese transporter [bacterium DOLZORAL124_64_63]|nr:MAG: manganese transporter [bacterium DOLZORAL124_64_63]
MKRWLLIPLFLFIVVGCGGGEADPDKAAADKTLTVVTTTMQTGDLVRRVGGARVDVTALMGPGIDPHQYKASAGDVERLGQADLIVYNGLHLEAKMGEVLERLNARQPTLAVARGIPEEELIVLDGAHDPHVWFDVALWLRALDEVTAKLSELDTAHAAEYAANAAAYRQELKELDAFCKARMEAIPKSRRILVTAHDAFNYLGRAYGLEVRGLQGISTVTEAGTADVQNLAQLIATRRIPALFVETSVSPRAIEAVQEAVKARGFAVSVGGELYSDAMGDEGTPEGTYAGMLRHNIETIAAALTAEGAHGH